MLPFLQRDRFGFHAVYIYKRTLPDLHYDFIDLLTGALELHGDRAGRIVPHPAGHAESGGCLHGPPPEADSLDPSEEHDPLPDYFLFTPVPDQ